MQAVVSAGSVAFGVVEADGVTFLSEVLVDADSGTEVVDLVFGPLSRCWALMIRNASNAGPSKVAIASVRVFRAIVSDLPAPPAELPPPSRLTPGPMARWERYYGEALPTLEAQIRARQLLQLTEPRPIRWLWGLRIIINPDTEIGRAIYLSGRYEPSTMHVMQRLLPEGGCFVDVGGNAGMFSLAAAAKVGVAGSVYVFEPSPREYKALRRNVELNALSNVTTLQQALSDSSGTTALRIAEVWHSGHNTLGEAFAYEDVETTDHVVVQMTTLDEFARDLSMDRLDLIKIDVEGAELKVLRGGRETLTRMRPVVILELFDAALRKSGASADAVRAFFDDIGYTLLRIADATGSLAFGNEPGESLSANVVAIPAEHASRIIEWVNA
jgi:FkbM family methyltransferase